MWIYLNNRFISEKEAKISVFDYGFLYGDGLFETLRAYNGKIFALTPHLNRLSEAAERLRLPLPPRLPLEHALHETLHRNSLKNAILRLTITRGENPLTLRPDLCKKGTQVITARPFSGHPAQYYENGVSATIVSIPRLSPDGKTPSIKSLNFLNNILGKLEINAEEHFEGLFLDAAGHLSEGTLSNLFWVKNGVLHTPSAETSILEGVTRRIVMDLAGKEGMAVEESLYPPEALFTAEEAFLTNTGIELMPLICIDGKNIGWGRPGPITQKLHEAFRKQVVQETGGE